eukprot:g1080.t1
MNATAPPLDPACERFNQIWKSSGLKGVLNDTTRLAELRSWLMQPEIMCDVFQSLGAEPEPMEHADDDYGLFKLQYFCSQFVEMVYCRNAWDKQLAERDDIWVALFRVLEAPAPIDTAIASLWCKSVINLLEAKKLGPGGNGSALFALLLENGLDGVQLLVRHFSSGSIFHLVHHLLIPAADGPKRLTPLQHKQLAAPFFRGFLHALQEFGSDPERLPTQVEVDTTENILMLLLEVVNMPRASQRAASQQVTRRDSIGMTYNLTVFDESGGQIGRRLQDWLMVEVLNMHGAAGSSDPCPCLHLLLRRTTEILQRVLAQQRRGASAAATGAAEGKASTGSVDDGSGGNRSPGKAGTAGGGDDDGEAGEGDGDDTTATAAAAAAAENTEGGDGESESEGEGESTGATADATAGADGADGADGAGGVGGSESEGEPDASVRKRSKHWKRVDPRIGGGGAPMITGLALPVRLVGAFARLCANHLHEHDEGGEGDGKGGGGRASCGRRAGGSQSARAAAAAAATAG